LAESDGFGRLFTNDELPRVVNVAVWLAQDSGLLATVPVIKSGGQHLIDVALGDVSVVLYTSGATSPVRFQSNDSTSKGAKRPNSC
jgi:hypothetical protein